MEVFQPEISHEKISGFVGQFAWPTLILAGVVISIYSATTVMVLTEQIPLATGTLVVSCLYYMSYTVFHEAVHGSISGSNERLVWVNDVLGCVMGQILCVSYFAHKKQHLKNHTHRHEPPSEKRIGFFREVASVAKLQYRDFFTDNWTQASAGDRRKVILEITLIVTVRGILILSFAGLTAALYFTASLLLGVLILIVLFIWCVHPPIGETRRYQNTVTFLFPKPLHWLITWLWLFQNYHIIHHLFPRVPFYRYREFFHEIEPELIQLNASIVRL